MEDESGSKFGCFGPPKGATPQASKVNEGIPNRTISKPSLSLRWWNSTSNQDITIENPEEPGLSDEDRLSFDMLGLEVDTTKPAPNPQSPAPAHERKLSWPFSSSRKVTPQPGSQNEDPSSHPSSHPSDVDCTLVSPSDFVDTPTSSQQHNLSHTDSEDQTTPHSESPDESRPQGYRRLWQSITNVRKGDKVSSSQISSSPEEYTVESLVRGVLSLKPSQHIIEAPLMADGLAALDSRAVAALLKELAKSGAPHRSSELFDYLRSLPDTDTLSTLVDLYTYTTIISQCGSHQHLRRALELVAEMRGRGIQCNIHTYSALMSVCVKCNESELALDVYDQIQSEGCTPNLVTYNILIDAYSRTGQWARAIEVLDPISKSGLSPEARTYNAVISACGKAGQPAAALQVYERMVADGVEPTGTTYTSVISAFGRAGQVDEAMQVYKDMSERGCEPNVITYSSLISVCERAGKAELALSLYHDMQKAGVRPNVVTFNGLIAACAHAGMWEKAVELVDSMPGSSCRPDGVTYSVLIMALERGGQWRQAIQALEKAQAAGVRPDIGAYNSALGALWSSGRLPAQRKSIQLLAAAQRQGTVRLQSVSAGESTATVHSPAAATLIVLKWLANFRDGLSTAAALASNSAVRSLFLVRGKHAPPDHQYEPTREVLNAMFTAFSVPATAMVVPQGLAIKADARVMPSWAASASGLALLSIFDYAASTATPAAASALLKEDRAVSVQCTKAFAAVQHFESTRSMSSIFSAVSAPAATAQRQDIIACITALSNGLQLREETAHDAVQFCDTCFAGLREINAAGSGHRLPSTAELPPAAACAAALLLLACRQASQASVILRQGQVVLQAAGLSLPTVLEAEQRIIAIIGPTPSAISPLRVLQLYMERMGCDMAALQKCQLVHVMSLAASGMVAKAAISPGFSAFAPSIVAAACLMKARESMGLTPAWPYVLQEMTGYSVVSGDSMKQCIELLHIMGICS